MLYLCEKCKKSMEEGNFYTYHDGTKTELCKKCLTMHIDNFDESTFLWLLEKMDVPYIPGEWNTLRDRAYAHNPQKMNGMSVFGKYLSKMKLRQFKDARWADSARLQAEAEALLAQQSDSIAARQAEIQAQYDNGEISEVQYRTLAATEAQMAAQGPSMQPAVPVDNAFDENQFLSEEEIDPGIELTYEDKLYLAMKWGRLYKPTEWIELERKYNEMVASFNIEDADTINTLIILCKTNLKMNQALDSGDLDGFKKLQGAYDSLRKTANFTAAQNKKEKGDFVDSIGELIVMCERDGFIPRFATDIPQDKVDFTLKDMKAYTYKLITQDLGFGQQIETALKKIEIQRNMEESERLKSEEEDGLIDEELSDADLSDFLDDVEYQKIMDAEMQKRGG